MAYSKFCRKVSEVINADGDNIRCSIIINVCTLYKSYIPLLRFCFLQLPFILRVDFFSKLLPTLYAVMVVVRFSYSLIVLDVLPCY